MIPPLRGELSDGKGAGSVDGGVLAGGMSEGFDGGCKAEPNGPDVEGVDSDFETLRWFWLPHELVS